VKLALAIQTTETGAIVPVALLSGAWEEKLAKAASLGVSGVELMTADPAHLDAARIRASIAWHRLEVAAVGSGAVALVAGLRLLDPDPATAAQAQARLSALIDFAAAVAAPLVTIGSFRGRIGSLAEGRRRLVAVLRAAAAYAQARGVRLALEPLNRYESDIINNVAEGLAFLLEVDHPALGLLLDTYHVNIEERSWTEPFRQAMLAGCLWHVHIGDNNRLPPGKGLIDFPAIVATLREIGYTGYLSAELLALPDPDTAAEQTLACMHRLLGV
jgi:sugar phosphate isomerase/epimerase